MLEVNKPRLKVWPLLSIFLFVVVAVGIFYFWPSGNDDAPPSMSIGSTLYKGQSVVNHLVNFDEDDKIEAAKVDKSGKISANIKNGVGYYFTEEDITLADLLDPEKCINPEVGETLFFTYSPGNESGMATPGFYIYPSSLASGGNVGIVDPAQFQVKKGRVFGLFSKSDVTGYCFKDATAVSNISASYIFENIIAGGVKDGWVQIAVKENSLGDALSSVKSCVNKVWVQDGFETFGTKIDASNSNYSFGKFRLFWVKLKGCGGADVSAEGQSGEADNSAGQSVDEPPSTEQPKAVVYVSATTDFPVINSVERGKSDVKVFAFQVKANGVFEFERLKIKVGTNGLTGLASFQLQDANGYGVGKSSLEGSYVIVDLNGYSTKNGDSTFVLSANVKDSSKLGDVDFSIEAANSIVLKNGGAVSGTFPIQNTVNIVAKLVVDQSLTDSDITLMTPVLTQSPDGVGKVKLGWIETSNGIKGYVLQGYVLQSKVGGGKIPAAEFVAKDVHEKTIDLSQNQYHIKVCAAYRKTGAQEDQYYCSNEVTVNAWYPAPTDFKVTKFGNKDWDDVAVVFTPPIVLPKSYTVRYYSYNDHYDNPNLNAISKYVTFEIPAGNPPTTVIENLVGAQGGSDLQTTEDQTLYFAIKAIYESGFSEFTNDVEYVLH